MLYETLNSSDKTSSVLEANYFRDFIDYSYFVHKMLTLYLLKDTIYWNCSFVRIKTCFQDAVVNMFESTYQRKILKLFINEVSKSQFIKPGS